LAGQGEKGPDDYRALPLDRYLAAHSAADGGRVGVLTIAGSIVDGNGGPGSAASETIARVLGDELAKKRIKALVVRVDSPGGSVTGSERMRTAILEAKRQGLPIVVSMGSVAASGGYWVATTGDTIFAEPSTITGSIGVFGLLPTFKGAVDKLGLSADGVATTPLSGQPDVFHGTTPAFDSLMQTGVENIYKRFTGLVAQARHMTPAQVDAIGQGHVWAGGTARQIHLVDRFGGLDDAIAFAAQQAKLTGADAQPRWIEREPSSWKGWLRDLARSPDREGEEAVDPWTAYARRPLSLLLGAIGTAKEIAAGPAIQIRCLECAPPPRGEPRATVGLLARLLNN
jgi:protease-4